MKELDKFFKSLNSSIDETINSTYEQRKLGRKFVNGLIVSTCWTDDEGYETAILDQRNTYPVERYENKEKAIEGHEKWCILAETINQVVRLGGMGGLVDDETFYLIRNESLKDYE